MYSTSHRLLIRLSSREIKSQVFDIFLKPFLNNFHTVAEGSILPKEATGIREYHCHKGVSLIDNYVKVGGV